MISTYKMQLISVLCIIALNLSVWALMGVMIWRPSTLPNSEPPRSKLGCGIINKSCDQSSERDAISREQGEEPERG